MYTNTLVAIKFKRFDVSIFVFSVEVNGSSHVAQTNWRSCVDLI